MLSWPVAEFSALVDKWVFVFSVFSRMLARLILLVGVATGAVASTFYFRTGAVPVGETLSIVARSRLFQVATAAIVVLNLRHILFRLRDRDVKN